jgi:predicted TIM-barrel fold metal-dependent hydrolase
MIDFHTHIIFMDELKTKDRWDMVGKYFTCADPKYPFGSRSIAEIETRMDYGRIDRAVVLPVDCERVRGESLLTNAEVKKLCDASPRLIGFASIDPGKASAMHDLEEARGLGLRGLKLDPGLQGFDLSSVCSHPMWRQVETYSWPVVIHAGFSFTPGMSMYATKLVDIERLALMYPGIDFVVAHWAFPWVMEAVLLAIKIPNLYLDSSMAYFDNPADYARFILDRQISASIMEKSIREKVVFGSNYPRVRMESMKAAYEKWPISDKAKACLFNDNAERLLGGGRGRSR